MSPLGLKAWVAGVLMLLVLAVGATWKVQDWRYGKQLAEQAGLHQSDLAEISRAAATQAKAEQDKRLALEQRLSSSEQNHHQELTNVQKDQDRLRDRLATSHLRLSVLLAEDPASGCAVPAAPAPSAWFMEEQEPNLTQRMLNELSPSPTTVTGVDCPGSLPGVRQELNQR
ncbi:lysis system i-spanin subunit Rz [Pseudomonas sp. NA13]